MKERILLYGTLLALVILGLSSIESTRNVVVGGIAGNTANAGSVERLVAAPGDAYIPGEAKGATITPTVTITRTATITPTATVMPTATITSTPGTRYSITVIKLNNLNRQPLAGWTMRLYAGNGCGGSVLQTRVTDATGMADFTNLSVGQYSVQEELQPGWTAVTSVCQDANVGLSSGAGVAERQSAMGPQPSPTSPGYPGPGSDTFPSGAAITLEIVDGPTVDVALDGPTTIQRSAPHPGPDGRLTIDTQIVSMDLRGNSQLGPIRVTQSSDPARPSLGQIIEQTPGNYFPADSYFDVLVRIETPMGVLSNVQPIHLESVIHRIPPLFSLYASPIITPINLYDGGGTVRGRMRYVLHVPMPPNEIFRVFRNRPPRSIIVIKLHHLTGRPLPGWDMRLHAGTGCTGQVLQTGTTNADGLVDFENLVPGDYSVEEVVQPGWQPYPGSCQGVNVPPDPPAGGAEAEVMSFTLPQASVPYTATYPPAGDDRFDSGAHVVLDLRRSGLGLTALTLNGPTTVHRGDPYKGTSGLMQIDTEITAMNLTGDSSFGPITVNESSQPAVRRAHHRTDTRQLLPRR